MCKCWSIKISKSGWGVFNWIQYSFCIYFDIGWFNSNFILLYKNTYLYHNMGRVVHGRCLISPSWAPLGGLDLWLQLIYALSWENQPQQTSLPIFKGLLLFSFSCQQNSIYIWCVYLRWYEMIGNAPHTFYWKWWLCATDVTYYKIIHHIYLDVQRTRMNTHLLVDSLHIIHHTPSYMYSYKICHDAVGTTEPEFTVMSDRINESGVTPIWPQSRS